MVTDGPTSNVLDQTGDGGKRPGQGRVCPWQHAYTFDNVFRRLVHNPRKIVGPYVEEGMRVLDVGCGMGFFAIAMARMVGDTGSVVAADLQQEMLDVLSKRAERAGVADRIHVHRCQADRVGIEGQVDFVLACWVVHELPDPQAFTAEVHACLRPGGKFLVAEPSFHVSRKHFDQQAAEICDAGFRQCDPPRVAFSRRVLFERV